MWGVKGKENCECEGVWGEKCGGAGGGKGRCVWDGMARWRPKTAVKEK